MRGELNHMKVYENVIVLTAEFAPFKSKRNGRLALYEVDAMVNLEQSTRA